MKSNFSNPLISIITVCFNSEATIERTMRSMLRQNYKNFEYWIIDGASSDRTVEIIREYEKLFNGRLHYISECDTGIYNAMNKGIKLCKGDIIGILNSDDYYSDDTLEQVALKYENESYELLVINGDMERVSKNDEIVCRYHFTEEHIKRKSCFGHPSMFASKAVYDAVGLYDETYKFAADGEWQYRAHECEKVRYVLVSKVFNHMREGGASDNPSNAFEWFKERCRMKIAHKKGSEFGIYFQELRSMFMTFLKLLLPSCVLYRLYRVKYE